MRERIEIYDEAQEMLICELDKLTKNKEITPSTLSYFDTIVDVIKDLEELSMGEEERINISREGYSQRSMPRYYSRGNSYRDYPYRKEPIMYNDKGYSHGNSKEDMLNYLYMAMDNAYNEEERKRVKRMIDEIENNK